MVNIECISKNFEKLNMNIHNFNKINVILVTIAAIVAAVGLMINNSHMVIASKIIGLALIPFISLFIMILSLNISQILFKSWNCIFFIIICLVTGLVAGLINSINKYVDEPTPEMLSIINLKYQNIYLELFVSILAGIGVYYAVIKHSIVALIGIILIMSIIPAITNAGLFYGMALYKSFDLPTVTTNLKFDNNFTVDKCVSNANNSLKLFMFNILGVFIGFIIMFIINCPKIKND